MYAARPDDRPRRNEGLAMFRTFIAGLVLVCVSAFAAEQTLVEITTSKGVIVCKLFTDECPLTTQNFLGLAEGTVEWTDAKGQKVKKPFYDGLTFHRVIPNFMIQGGCPLGTGTGDPGFKFKDEINADSVGLDKELMVDATGQPNQGVAYMMKDVQAKVLQPILAEILKAEGVVDPKPGMKLEPAVEKKVRDAFMARVAKISLKEIYTKLGYTYDQTLPSSHKPVRGVLAMANSGPNTNGSQFFINVADTPHLLGKHTVFGEVVSGMEFVDAISAVAKGANDKPVEPVTITSIRRKK
jgi:peptidyl-prolyl cis-trans isomerase A (cyclophilin A)